MNWDGVKKSAVPNLKTLGALGAGSLAKVSNFIKIEILRDFWQIVSTFFEGLEDALPKSFNDVAGNVSGTVSFCFSCWWNDPDIQKWFGILMFVGMGIASIVASIVFYCITSGNPDDQNQGLDVVGWNMRSKGYKKKLKYLLMMITTLYLPVFRDSILSLSCDLKFFPKTVDCKFENGVCGINGVLNTAKCIGTSVLDCKPKVDDECKTGVYYGMATLAVFAMLLFVIPMPILLYRLVKKNKPVPSLFDAEGARRVGGYTKGDYRADLDKDECPYKVLYNGYERDWAGYKVIVMVIKILLVLPVVLITSTNKVGDRADDGDKTLLAVQCGIVIATLLIYSVLSTYSAPFIKDSDDQVDVVARYSALIVASLGFIASRMSGDSARTIFGIVLNVVTFLSGAVIAFYVISGFKAVQTILKKIGQRVTLTETRDTGEPLVFSDTLDIAKERKFRIWHEFWDTLIRQDRALRIPVSREQRTEGDDEEAAEAEPEAEEDVPPEEGNGDGDEKEEEYEPKNLGFQYGGSPPFLLDFENTVGERHAENKEIVEHESFASYKAMLAVAVRTDDEVMAQSFESMKYIVTKLNGLDVFWDGPCINLGDEASDDVQDAEEIGNGSATKFGKMYIVPYPFCAVFLSDDCDSATALFSVSPVIAGKIVDAEKGIERLNQLVARNEDPEIQRRKEVRLKLRALRGSMCHWPIQKHKSKTISRQVAYQDDEGNTKHRTETKMVQVLFSFNDGTFCIGRDSTTAMWRDVDVTRGFVSNLHYRDGTGSHTDAAWGTTTNWNNEPITVYGDDFGLNDQFEETDRFQHFMRQNYHDDMHEPKKAAVIAQFARYSDFYRNTFMKRERVLSYAFWYYVYNNDGVEREHLMEFLKLEQNARLKALAEDGQYLESVAMVFDKLNFFNTDKRHSVWFIFWHDLWMNNMFMPPFVENEDFLSPFKGSSICYQYQDDKAELIKQLEEKGVCFKSSALRKGWVNPELIDLLYAKMDAVSGVVRAENEEAAAEAAEENEDLVEDEEAAVEEHGDEQVAVEIVRKCATAQLCADIDITEEYARACTMMTAICGGQEE